MKTISTKGLMIACGTELYDNKGIKGYCGEKCDGHIEIQYCNQCKNYNDLNSEKDVLLGESAQEKNK